MARYRDRDETSNGSSSDISYSSDEEYSDYKRSKDIGVLTNIFKKSTLHDPSYSIMTINVKFGENGNTISADDRRKFYTKLVVDEHADITVMQESIKKDITTVNNAIKEKYNGSKYSYHIKDKQAAVLTKDLLLTQETMDVTGTDLRTFDTLAKQGVVGRLALTKVSRKGKHSDHKFAIGSWHGPHIGIKKNDKKQLFKELCKMMNKKFGDLPWIIGGDFNLDYDDAKENAPDKINITKGTKEKIIYFVHTASITVSNVITLQRSEGENEYIDHYPITATIDVKYEK